MFLKTDSVDEIVRAFQDTLIPTNRTPRFYVNWTKVKENVDEIKLELALWNRLMGSQNPKNDFVKLIRRYPESLRVLPILLAIRELEFPVIEDFTSSEIRVANLRFNIGRDFRLSEGEVTEYSDFAEKSGIFLLFSAIKDFYDYVLGVEVGMDTNARKNRSGDAMETVLKPLIEDISGELMSRFFSQTTFGRVGEQFGRDTAPLQNRRADFILSKGGDT